MLFVRLNATQRSLIFLTAQIHKLLHVFFWQLIFKNLAIINSAENTSTQGVGKKKINKHKNSNNCWNTEQIEGLNSSKGLFNHLSSVSAFNCQVIIARQRESVNCDSD